MLEFTNYPPQSPNDVHLSESGIFLLVDADKFHSDTTATETLGRAICAELVEALDVSPETAEFSTYSQQVRDEVAELLRVGGPGRNADKPSAGALSFMQGMDFVEKAFHRTPTPQEVAAV